MSQIPTTYRGVRFRSRLEAKWAAFFDGLEWPWSYEPIDLKGYIPDFVLLFPDPLLVEVKPVFQAPCNTSEELTAFNDYIPKIERSGWRHEALIVGAECFEYADRYGDYPGLGLLGEVNGDDEDPGVIKWWWGPGLLFFCSDCRKFSIFHDESSYHCRRSGCYSGDGHLESPNLAMIRDFWVTAGNRTQWMAR